MAQEAFKNLREKDKMEMLEKKKKIDEAHDKMVATNLNKEKKKKVKGVQTDEWPREESKEIKKTPSASTNEKKVEIKDTREHEILQVPSSHHKLPIPKPEHAGDSHQIKVESVQNYHHHHRKRLGKCTNCCGGLPGQGPRNPRGRCGAGQSHCNSEDRLRGGSDDHTRWSQEDRPKKIVYRSSSVPPDKAEFQRSPRSVRELGYSSPRSVESEKDSAVDSSSIRSVERSRGGCGGCGGSPQSAARFFHRSKVDRYQRESVKLNNHMFCPPPPCCQSRPPVLACQRQQEPCAKISFTSTKACCPCGGCGGAACSDNPGGGGVDGGCCGGSQLPGLPCKCKCQSCNSSRPLGGCGGQSCGRIYSCAGSGGGKCCFPRNHKRRSGANCCGGNNSSCGGCC